MKKEKNETEKSISGRDERGGAKAGRMSWQGKIAHSLQACGTENRGLWFTHKGVIRRLQEHGHENVPESLTQFLRDLVLSGHIERAIKPDKGEYRPRKEFIYRRTAKAFKPSVMGQGMNAVNPEDIQKAWQRRLDHKRLPKWFRDMME